MQGPRPGTRALKQLAPLDDVQSNAARTAAEIGSRDLLRKLLSYGSRNRGLPNMTPECCRTRLFELGAAR